MGPQFKLKVSGIVVIIALILASIPNSVVHSQMMGGYICGRVELSEQPTPDPYGQNLGTGPIFKPYGSNDQSQWWIFHPLGVDVQSLNNFIFFDTLAGNNVRIWNPEFSGNTVFRIGSYEVVDSCEPAIQFYADSDSILSGECTAIHWSIDASGLNSVYLDDQFVDPVGELTVCPATSTTYQLRVSTTLGEYSPTLTINIHTPTPVPMLYGVSKTVYVQSGMTAYPRSVIVPCASSEPIEYGSLGIWGDEKLYGFFNPVFEPINEYKTSLGVVKTRLTSWGGVEEIGSCQDFGLGQPNPQLEVSLVLKSISWEPDPLDFEPVTLILKVRAEGSEISNSAYIVEITFGKDFPYETIHYVLDSQDLQSASHLNPGILQQGDYEILVSSMLFPMTYSGSLYVTLRLKDSQTLSTSSKEITVGSSNNTSRFCSGALLKATALLIDVPIEQDAQIKVTNEYLNTQEQIQACGDNATCQSDSINAFQQTIIPLAIESGIKIIGGLSPAARIALALKKAIEVGLDSTKCSQWLIEYVKQTLHISGQVQNGPSTSGFLTASPVFPLVTATNGQKTGFLSDGSIVEEIPDSFAVQIGEERLLLFPGNVESKFSITGYAQGSMNLYTFLAQPDGGYLDASYQSVPVEINSQMALDPKDSQFALNITFNGETQPRYPDEVVYVSISGERSESEPTRSTENIQDKSPFIELIQKNITIILAGVLVIGLFVIAFSIIKIRK